MPDGRHSQRRRGGPCFWSMTTPSIHGHTVLNHILDLGGSESLTTLRNWVQTSHGLDARYHTCSVRDLTYEGLLQLLLERNKIEVTGDRIRVIADYVCSHDHEHADVSHAHRD